MGGRWERVRGNINLWRGLWQRRAQRDSATPPAPVSHGASAPLHLCTLPLHLCTLPLHRTAPLHCTSTLRLCTALRFCTAPCWIRMVAPGRRWASLFSLTCCLALLQGQLLGAAPLHPKYPGDDAPMEDLVQFYQELQQYLNMVTRPRYGKRASSRTLCGDPSGC